jgi:hypothetical protein
MEHTANSTSQVKVRLDRMLENAVILSWDDLPHDLEPGLVHVEYAPAMALDYLKIWQLVAKGAWSLICEYWMVPQPVGSLARLTFSNGYHSEGLAQMLEEIMQHQEDFTSSKGPGAGMIQVTRPSEERKQIANATIKQAWNKAGIAFEPIPSIATA